MNLLRARSALSRSKIKRSGQHLGMRVPVFHHALTGFFQRFNPFAHLGSFAFMSCRCASRMLAIVAHFRIAGTVEWHEAVARSSAEGAAHLAASKSWSS